MAISKAKASHADELQRVPGVGPSVAEDLRGIGIKRIADLKGKDPERLYAQSNAKRGVVQDRCLLYVFRCAVYFAETPRPNPEKLNWWAWKDLK
jgi:predicted RecB family nuclease